MAGNRGKLEPKYEVGQKFWKFDQNHRVYVNDDGTRSLSPIYIKHFVPWYLIGMTSRSYLLSRSCNPAKSTPTERDLSCAQKVPLNNNLGERGYIDSWEKVEALSWVNDNKWRISEDLRHTRLSKDQLQRIEAIINEKK